MCGLAAIYQYHRDSGPVSREELVAVRDAMTPRGPDGAGLWISNDGRIGLAHRRLAILDLSEAGTQPMSADDGRYRIVFNGEIYNFRELRRELEGRGCRFRTQTDTEVLLYAYRIYGRGMVSRLRGMFAFAIWDEEKKAIFLARDHFGIKPLYYYDDGSSVRIASQVRALIAGGHIPTTPEAAGHVGFFIWGSVPEPYTLYRNLYALPAGHTLWIDRDGPREPECYFDVAEAFVDARENATPHHDDVTAVAEALRASIQAHLVSDVPVGVFLSAGLDSGTIAALVSERSQHLHAITLGFAEYANTERDEVPLARTLAAHYGFRQDVEMLSQEQFVTELDHVLRSMDQPSIDGVNTFFVARAAARHGLKVVLSGLGGDEVFCGYPGFAEIPRLVSATRGISRAPGFGSAWRMVSAPLLKHFTSSKYAGIFEYGGSYAGAYLLRRGLFMPWELPRFLDKEMVREGWARLNPVMRLDKRVRDIRTPSATISAMELSLYMRNQLLRDADWAGMAHSLEIRVPWVDIEVFKTMLPLFNGQLPTKHLMVQAATKPLPDAILNKRKTGFSIPVESWLGEYTGIPSERGYRGWAQFVAERFGIGPPTTLRQGRSVFALLTDAYGSQGGIAKFNRDLLSSLSSSPEVSTVVVVPRLMPHAQHHGLPPKLDYDTSGINSRFKYIIAVARSLHRYRRFDLILCGHIYLLPVAFLAKLITRAPVYCVVHGIDAWQPTGRLLTDMFAKRVDGFIAVSATTRERLGAWTGVDARNIHLLPNCVDRAAYSPGHKSSALVERYGLAGKTVLLTLGRLASTEAYKGFDEVIAALPELARHRPNISYVIAGHGDDQERLSNKAGSFGVSDRVVFTGFVPEHEKADLYRLADAYVMPSRGEGFGIVLLEAMASGVPVMGSRLDGSREALLDGKLGILVNPSDPNDVIRGILDTLKQPRGIPDGLDHFSTGRFRERVFNIIHAVGNPASQG